MDINDLIWGLLRTSVARGLKRINVHLSYSKGIRNAKIAAGSEDTATVRMLKLAAITAETMSPSLAISKTGPCQ